MKNSHLNHKIYQAEVALKVFFRSIEEWGLSEEQAQQLLNVTNKQYCEYKEGIINSTAHNLMSRLAIISMIYGSLKQLYSVENRKLWLKNTSQSDSIWKGYSPLEVMMNDYEGIIMVHNYLNHIKQ